MIDFSATGIAPLMDKIDKNLRWEDKERAALSACSSLIATVQHRGSHLLQFSHFSVKEFLTLDRLAASTVDTLRYHHIRLKAAHMMMDLSFVTNAAESDSLKRLAKRMGN